MNKRTRKLQFTEDEKRKIYIRQYGQCLFCEMKYHMNAVSSYEYDLLDFMHYINRSQGGLGIAENGVLGCRYHHSLLDNGNKGLREEMLQIMKDHLKAHYPEWSEKNITHNKWRFLE